MIRMTETGMANVKAVTDRDENGVEMPMRLVLEFLSPGTPVPRFALNMDDAAKCDELVAAIVKCREYIWGPSAPKGGA